MSRQSFILSVGFLCLWGCESYEPAQVSEPREPAPIQAVQRGGEPVVRVRIARAAGRLEITGPATLKVYPQDRPDQYHLIATPTTLSRLGGQWIGRFQNPGMPSETTVVIEPVGPLPIRLNKTAYHGSLRLVARSPTADTPADADKFDVVNHIRMEEYLPGVLDRELYDRWEPSVYLALAIAARSYAIDRIVSEGPGRHFDVENTQASQAYSGQTQHMIAQRAVADTVGLVLTYQGQVVQAYYSSTCGSANQSAADAFGIAGLLPQLQPDTPCQWCKASPHYAWGTVAVDRRELSRRLAAWGRQNRQAIERIGVIRQVRVSQANRFKRPTQFEILDDKGQKFLLRSESFRSACNYSNASAPRICNLKSSAVAPMVEGEKVYFKNGRGFGHCVGLCQYGAQGMAKSGRKPFEILGSYYPGAAVERAY